MFRGAEGSLKGCIVSRDYLNLDRDGEWRALKPGFVFFGASHDRQVLADLADPHGNHMADAMPELRGLADCAERFANDFRCIESVAETGGKLRALDVTKASVRQAVREARSARASYESELASDY